MKPFYGMFVCIVVAMLGAIVTPDTKLSDSPLTIVMWGALFYSVYHVFKHDEKEEI